MPGQGRDARVLAQARPAEAAVRLPGARPATPAPARRPAAGPALISSPRTTFAWADMAAAPPAAVTVAPPDGLVAQAPPPAATTPRTSPTVTLPPPPPSPPFGGLTSAGGSAALSRRVSPGDTGGPARTSAATGAIATNTAVVKRRRVRRRVITLPWPLPATLSGRPRRDTVCTPHTPLCISPRSLPVRPLAPWPGRSRRPASGTCRAPSRRRPSMTASRCRWRDVAPHPGCCLLGVDVRRPLGGRRRPAVPVGRLPPGPPRPPCGLWPRLRPSPSPRPPAAPCPSGPRACSAMLLALPARLGRRVLLSALPSSGPARSGCPGSPGSAAGSPA